jgi:hypothetical protein
LTRTQRQIESHRQAEVCVQVRDAAGRACPGVPVWAEQETHTFVFGCVTPDLDALPEPDRQRCRARLHDVFNRVVPAGAPPEPGGLGVEVPRGVHLGRFRLDLDRLASAGLPLDVHVRGQCLGLGAEAGSDERASAERVAALYAVCFAHPAVRAVYWHGFWDGEEGVDDSGLVRGDCTPRPAFRYLEKLIGTIWHSRASGQTGPDGCFRFRGFLGDYRVAARIGEGAAVTARVPGRRGAARSRLTVAAGCPT